MDTTQQAPQYSPVGGVGTQSGGFTYGANNQWSPTTPVAPVVPKKDVSVITSGPAKKVVSGMQNAVNTSNNSYGGLLNDTSKAKSELDKSLLDIRAGNLTPQEQQMIDNQRSLLSSDIERQRTENKNFEKGTEIMGIRSGRQRYASEVQSGYQKAAIDQGITKVNELNMKMNESLYKIQKDLKEGKIKDARDTYNDYNDFIKQRFGIIKEMNDHALAVSKAKNDGNLAKTRESLLAYEKYKNDAKDLGHDAMSYADWAITANGASNAASNPVNITQEYAKQHSLPVSLVGKTTSDIIGSLKSEEVPDWFTLAYGESNYGVNTQPGQEDANLKALWNQFRQDPTVLASTPQSLDTSSSGDLY